MVARGAKGLFSITTVFASFFGAALIAGAFAYYNYTFSKYRFIDFSKFVFYTDKDVFTPKAKKYIVVFFSSKNPNAQKKIAKLSLKNPILAIDYYNKKIQSNSNVVFLRSGTNTVLRFIQRFNIYDEPVMFVLKKQNTKLYKQDSMIRKFDTIDDILEKEGQ